MEDPHKVLICKPPVPCNHGNGSNCECQLPHYSGLFVLPIRDKNTGITRHIIGRMKQAYDGGMREFIDPITGDTVGSCGLYFAASDVLTITEFKQKVGTRW